MKKSTVWLIPAIMLVGLGFSQASFAKQGDVSVDAGFKLGTSPCCGFGIGFGGGVGAGYEVLDNLQVRGDFNYLTWSKSGVDYDRILFGGAGRYYVAVMNNLKVYGQAGMEISVDKGTVAGFSSTTAHFGAPIALGAEFAVTPNIGIEGQAAFHLVTDSYLTFGVNGVYHF